MYSKLSVSFIIALAILLLAACGHDALVEEAAPVQTPQNGKTVIVTASIALTNACFVGAKVNWKKGDRIQLFFVQDSKDPVEGLAVNLTEDAISPDGTIATFEITVPDGIDKSKAYTLYGTHATNPVTVEDGKILVLAISTVFVGLESLGLGFLSWVAPIGFTAAVNPGENVSVTFRHLAALNLIELKNISSAKTRITNIDLLPVDASAPLWYFPLNGANYTKAHYDLITGEVEYKIASATTINHTIELFPNFKTTNVRIVFPTNNSAPEIKLSMKIDDVEKLSVNSKPAQKAPQQAGKAYWLYGVWDGTKLEFTGSDFAPLPPSFPPFPATHVFARLAKFNVGATPKTWAESHKNNASGYYTQENAAAACPVGYRLPSVVEMEKFMPSPQITFNATTGLAYSILGTGVEHTAYRYRRVGVFEQNNLDSHWEITGRYLGTEHDGVEISTVVQEEWWAAGNGNDIVHIFPACGSEAFAGVMGRHGKYWTSSKTQSNRGWGLSFYSENAILADESPSFAISVRPIKE